MDKINCCIEIYDCFEKIMINIGKLEFQLGLILASNEKKKISLRDKRTNIGKVFSDNIRNTIYYFDSISGYFDSRNYEIGDYMKSKYEYLFNRFIKLQNMLKLTYEDFINLSNNS